MYAAVDWQPFASLSTKKLYEILQLRTQVFVLEQQCLYQDLDGHDEKATHGCVVHEGKLIGYIRVFAPGDYYQEASLGRIVSAPDARGTGLGKHLIQGALAWFAKHYPASPIKIWAQHYLVDFYKSHGFECIGEPGLEDGILHVMMLRAP